MTKPWVIMDLNLQYQLYNGNNGGEKSTITNISIEPKKK